MRHALIIIFAISIVMPLLYVRAEPQGTSDDSPFITETTITEIKTTEVSDRESRLRTMEDELLKQLSVGSKSPTQPARQVVQKPSLAEIKQVSEEVTPPKSKSPTTSPSRPSDPYSPPTSQQSTRSYDMDEAPAKVPVVSYEEVPTTAARRPQAAAVVPVLAKSAPQQKVPTRKYATPENLSAKDLEHRLAIAETQLNLLTHELESTKSKLATSEARVRELTDQIEDGVRASSTLSTSTTNVEARGVAVTVADIGTRPSNDAEVARITKNKTPLRIGPGARESIITHLSRDAVVTIEHRTSGWYRVVTGDGARGWIPGSYLVFDTKPYSDSTVHVGAYEPQLEPTGGLY
ncbi:MAG: Bacterial domain [Pseudomonadota bacterium]|jgi:hypothetical protein